DPDDAILTTKPVVVGDTATLDGGVRIIWQRPASLSATGDTPLRFTVREADGSGAKLEPYLGMPAHAMVSRDDGAVFMHLHAMGPISPAAQQVLLAVERGDTLPSIVSQRRWPRPVLHSDSGATHASMMSDSGELTFPFAFPEPGRYKIWVQLKRA